MAHDDVAERGGKGVSDEVTVCWESESAHLCIESTRFSGVGLMLTAVLNWRKKEPHSAEIWKE